MKRARSYDLLGEFEKVRNAADIEERERAAHEYRCLNPACPATFHFRRAANPLENTAERAACFVHNSNSPHMEKCDYDYENKASRHRRETFFKDGLFHLRANFPLGSDPQRDVYPGRTRLSAAQRQQAEKNADKRGIGTLAAAVRLIEEEFKNLEGRGLENLVLYYQGRRYEWNNIFTPADGYGKIFDVITNLAGDETRPLLVVAMPEHEAGRNDNGKKKISCRAQEISVNGHEMKIQPVLVFKTDGTADKINIGETLLIAGRPFIPRQILQQSQLPYASGVPAYFYIHDQRQIARIDDNYWRNCPGTQMKLFDRNPK